VSRRVGKLIVSQAIKRVIKLPRVDIASLYEISTVNFLNGYIRLAPFNSSDFPLNDDGLFYTRIQDLKKDPFNLPLYNSANIPSAYLQFPFYIAAWLLVQKGLYAIDVVHMLPAIISILTIPPFYMSCKPLMGSNFQAPLATTAFALLPGSALRLL